MNAVSAPTDPVMVEITRGPAVESLHRGCAAVCDASGQLVAAWGDVGRAVFPRSTAKPLQALPLIETGAAERYGVSDLELALACASHSGEPMHTEPVAAWLARLGLSEADLECGAHAPTDLEAARTLVRHGHAPSALHNNCSGKHTGMLATALHCGEPTRAYINADHPVQQRVAQVLWELTGARAEETPCGIDGCGIPTFGLPLTGFATALARLADPTGLGPVRAAAARRIFGAMTGYPELVAGTGRLCSEVMRAAPAVLVKGGAEGVYAAILPGRGLGVALKVDDGAGRASEVAVLALLRHLGAFTAAEEEALRARHVPPVRNVAGKVVGVMRPSAEWLG